MREVAGRGRSRHLVGGGSCGLVKLQGNYLVALHCLNQRKAMWMIFELSLTAPIEYGDCESYGGGQ
jgi:hypothetical protein